MVVLGGVAVSYGRGFPVQVYTSQEESGGWQRPSFLTDNIREADVDRGCSAPPVVRSFFFFFVTSQELNDTQSL